MSLELTVEKLDSVPEALRGAYVEKDGKFHLDVTGVVSEAEITGLKSALGKERASRATLEKQVKTWEAAGKTPEEVAALVAAANAAETEAAKKSGNFEAILKQKQEKWDGEKASLETELKASRASERGAIIETSVMGALTKAKATSEGTDLLTERLSKRINFETVDGKRVIRIMQADGKTPMAGAGADGGATFDDLVTEAKKSWPSLFEGTGAGGGGKSPKDAKGETPGDKSIVRAEWDKLTPYEQAAKIKAGFKPVD
jgi:hypothetical protein